MLPDWQARAACRPDPRWSQEQVRAHVNRFFPERGTGIGDLRTEFCNVCPVKEACTEYALTVGNGLVGAWGGLSESQRKRVRRDRKKAA